MNEAEILESGALKNCDNPNCLICPISPVTIEDLMEGE